MIGLEEDKVLITCNLLMELRFWQHDILTTVD